MKPLYSTYEVQQVKLLFLDQMCVYRKIRVGEFGNYYIIF